ncbi:MAG: T9SS type A sorting domain-containing protein [Candidatus Kapaibacterium sp.]
MPFATFALRNAARGFSSMIAGMLLLLAMAAPAVAQGSIQVNTPNGGEQLFVGDPYAITWTSPGIDFVRLEYSTNGGATWLDIVPGGAPVSAASGSYAWMVPNTPGATTLVRVSNSANPIISDRSDALFSILRPSLQVISPNGGEGYEVAAPVTVRWSAQNITSLTIEYSSDLGTTWKVVGSGVPAASGSYTFVPMEIPTKLALVRITDMAHPRVSDQSDRTFEILEPKSIMVYDPTGGEKLLRGSTMIIRWDAPRIAAVDVLFSANGGATWQPIATNIRAKEWYYVWTVPNVLVSEGKIRVQEVNGSVIGESGLFEIVDPKAPVLRVIRPNGGEKYDVGDSVNVLWSSSGVAGPVSISYSTNSGGTWQLIRGGVPVGFGVAGWRITSAPGNRYRVKVESTPALSDASDADFTVTRKLAPSLRVIYPNGGERLLIGTIDTIRWITTDVSGLVKIEYSNDSGRTWKAIATIPNTGDGNHALFNWIIPDDTTRTALIRVINVAMGDTSDAVFEIYRNLGPPITVVSPNGGEIWRTDQKYKVTWTAPASITSVDIDFAVDGGGPSWAMVARNAPSRPNQLNEFEWVVPTVQTTGSAKIRVRNSANGGENDISDQSFTILAPLSVSGIEARTGAAAGLHLLGAYPNPATGRTEIRWRQERSGDVRVELYRESGEMVGRTELGTLDAGEQRHGIALEGLAAGIYLYRIRQGAEAAHGMITLIR